MRSFTLLGLVALFGSTVAVACAAPPAPEPFSNETSTAAKGTKKSKSTATSEDSPAPAATTEVTDRAPPSEPPPAAPVQATDTVWTGTLAKTVASKFGGDPYCEYQTHLEEVSVKVVVGADGKVKSANVSGKAVEESLNGCPNPPIAPNLHDYALATETGTSFSVDGGGTEAQPHAKMDATFSASGVTGSIQLKFQRNDQAAPLVWTIDTTVPLHVGTIE